MLTIVLIILLGLGGSGCSTHLNRILEGSWCSTCQNFMKNYRDIVDGYEDSYNSPRKLTGDELLQYGEKKTNALGGKVMSVKLKDHRPTTYRAVRKLRPPVEECLLIIDNQTGGTEDYQWKLKNLRRYVMEVLIASDLVEDGIRNNEQEDIEAARNKVIGVQAIFYANRYRSRD